MNKEECLKTIQKYLENNPLVVLGSGASLPYGLPSMKDLQAFIASHKAEFVNDCTSTLWSNLESMNLEEAVDKSNLSEEGKQFLRKIVWECVNNADLKFFEELISKTSNFPLAELFRKIIRPTPNRVNVITTNYDRLAEYAADYIDATATTGFEGCFLQKPDFPTESLRNRSINARERVISIWKVHGSLDWFTNGQQAPVSYPHTRDIPSAHIPLIIPPGKDKNSATHAEPFRDIITQADNAFKSADAFLCIGYGFNDEHIQPKLISQIRSGKPIVILAKQATDSCKRNVIQSAVAKRIIVEEAGDGKTKANVNDTDLEFGGDLWNLETFIQQTWGN
jgi:hypothetical protein